MPLSLIAFRNYFLTFGLIAETCLAVLLSFAPGFSDILFLKGLRYVAHWTCGEMVVILRNIGAKQATKYTLLTIDW